MRQFDSFIAGNIGYRIVTMAKKISLHPAHPERICWGCDKYCPADSLSCGNGSERALHPVELFGEDWLDWGLDSAKKPAEASDS